jgi:PA14 domain
MKQIPFAVGAAVLAAVASLSSARPTVPASSSVGDVPGSVGNGLNGSIWSWPGGNFGTVDTITATDPASTFRSTLVDYPNASDDIVNVDGSTLGAFLGSDAGTLAGSFDSSTQVGSLLFRFSGFIAIQNAGDVIFAVGSDDGARLTIGGVLITGFDGDRGFGFSSDTATFEAGGLYPVELIYWANGVGQSGVEWYSSIPGGPDSGTPFTGGSIVPTDVLYTVIPAPTAAAVFGLAGVLVARRRR